MLWKCTTIFFALAVAGLQYRLWVGPGSLTELATLKRDVASQQVANRELATRNRLLEVEVADLEDGLDTVEEIAREELGMVRDGETFFLVIEGEDQR